MKKLFNLVLVSVIFCSCILGFSACEKSDIHNWNEGVIITEPTYTDYGLMVYTCIDCGETKIVSIDPLKLYVIGDAMPEITIDQIFDSNGAYSLDGKKYEKFSTNLEGEGILSSKGIVTITVFWYTELDPAVAQMSYLSELKEEYEDDILILAIHIDNDIPDYIIQSKIDYFSWQYSDIVFLKETTNYESLFYSPGAYPFIVITNAKGIITYSGVGLLDDEKLKIEIDSALK